MLTSTMTVSDPDRCATSSCTADFLASSPPSPRNAARNVSPPNSSIPTSMTFFLLRLSDHSILTVLSGSVAGGHWRSTRIWRRWYSAKRLAAEFSGTRHSATPGPGR